MRKHGGDASGIIQGPPRAQAGIFQQFHELAAADGFIDFESNHAVLSEYIQATHGSLCRNLRNGF
ncbi:MAG: hypothetical protein ACTTKK_04350 [Ottowia sp.]